MNTVAENRDYETFELVARQLLRYEGENYVHRLRYRDSREKDSAAYIQRTSVMSSGRVRKSPSRPAKTLPCPGLRFVVLGVCRLWD